MATTDPTPTRHAIQRVRHPLLRRTLTVVAIEQRSARMRRICFESPTLDGFLSPSPDDHVKLFFPSARGEPAMRDFTPRAFDTQRRTLSIDFALHEGGPATEWASRAQLGDTLDIGGPRGSRLVTDDFDWYLLVADESALPALGRWVESLRPGVPVMTLACIADDAERQVVTTRAEWTARWITRGAPSERDAALLLEALTDLEPPRGDVRAHPRAWVRASGYWQRGERAAHLELED
jgi:NADPH-dependent ferric siderophore reductase